MFRFLFQCVAKKNRVYNQEQEQKVEIEIQNATQKKKHFLMQESESQYSKQVSLGSVSTFSTSNQIDSSTKQMKIVDYVYEKIISEKNNRRLIEQKVIRKFVNMKAEKNLMLNIEWADQYTNYLRGEPVQIKSIFNQALQLKFTNDPEQLIEDIDYVLVNDLTWLLLVKMYGGGPTIKTDPTIDFLLNSIVPAVGLSNESQYCYMNAALQVLVSTEQFALYFLRDKYKTEQKEYLFCSAISEFINGMRTSASSGVYNNTKFKQIIDQKFSPQKQHDSQEFILFLFNKIQEETNQTKVIPKDTNYKDLWDNYNKNFTSIVDQLFTSLICSTISCSNCKHISENFEITHNLVLQINKNQNTVNDCLIQFFQEEEDQYKCEKCNKYSTKKKFSIINYPQILMLTFQRTKSEKNQKKLDFIQINNDLINIQEFFFLNRYMYSAYQGQINYKIKAICCHIGQNIDQGHYTVMGMRGDQWYQFNDNIVNQIDRNQIDQLQAYILICEKIE